jgi:hypothetical protein
VASRATNRPLFRLFLQAPQLLLGIPSVRFSWYVVRQLPRGPLQGVRRAVQAPPSVRALLLEPLPPEASSGYRKPMTIFDDITREDTNPPYQDDTAFAYLNRSGRPEAARVRQLVDDWLTHYPAHDRDSLVARLRSAIDDQHRGAFFELFIHELVITRGHKVVAIEPKLAHTEKSPDFLVEAKEGHQLYLECVVATGRSQQEVAEQARLNKALTAINRTPPPVHFLDLSVHGAPTAPISIKKMKRMLLAWIAKLPDDDTCMDAAPFEYEECGVSISLRSFPRRNRDRAGRAIGARFFPVRQVTDDEDVRGALEKKASRYGTLDHPYVVAVNALGVWARESNAEDALFGSPCLVVRRMEDGTITREEDRNTDGVWWGPAGGRRKRLSAVLSTEQIDPWNFASRHGRLIHNPWATAPLPTFELGIDDYERQDGGYRIKEGRRMGELVGLPEGWPKV